MTVAAAGIALLVVLILANPPSVHALLFDGGFSVGVFGLAMMALIPLIVMVQIGFGAALARLLGGTEAPETWLLWLSGSALMSLLGVALALASLINPWVCGGLLLFGMVYAVGSGACMDGMKRTVAWASVRDVISDKPLFAAIRLGIVAGILIIGLRAATGELNDSDFVQFYWRWLNEVRHFGGVRLDPDLPLYQDFAQGRGNGNYLLLAGFAPGLVSHVMSAAFCILFAVVMRVFVLRSAAASAPLPKPPLILLAADLACLTALWMLPGAVSFGKYHLQFAVWAVGLLLACIAIATEANDAAVRMRRGLLIPLAVAISVGLAQFEAFIGLVLVLAVLLAPLRWLAARRLLPLLIVGGVSAVLSLLANWLYLGIPDLNPFSVFERLIIEARFDLWTSRLAQYYINYIQGGAFSLKANDGAGTLRNLRTLFGEIQINAIPLLLIGAALGMALVAAAVAQRRRDGSWVILSLGVALGYGLWLIWQQVVFSELALTPMTNRLLFYAAAVAGYMWAIGGSRLAEARPYLLGMLGYWLICDGFTLVFHSGSMLRLMRHADVVGIGLLLVAIVFLEARFRKPLGHQRPVDRAWPPRSQKAAAMAISLAVGLAFSYQAAVMAAAVQSPRSFLARTLGVHGRALALTNPMANFERCLEVAEIVPHGSRVLFLNAYTAMGYCNNALLMPRGMVVLPHESAFSRETEAASFADADTVENTLRRLKISTFVVLKHDFEFWNSGLAATFRPDEMPRRFDLLAETSSFYVLTWHGGGHAIPPEALAAISEWRRFGIQQSGFMAQNEFISQWRAMANLGADRPKYQLGARLDFSAGGWSALYADHGWYAAEPHGTWTVGPYAKLTLPLAQPTEAPLRLAIEVMPFLIPQIPKRTVRVKLAGAVVANWKFQLNEGYRTLQIDLPAGSGMGPKDLELTFEIENAVSQYALGLNADWRPLGIAVRALTVEAVVSNSR